MDLTPYKLAMQPIPNRVEMAISSGVRQDLSFPLSDASNWFQSGSVSTSCGIAQKK